MKLTTQKHKLLKPLGIVCAVVSGRTAAESAILSNVMIQCENTGLTLIGSDLETEVRVTLPLVSEEINSLTVPAQKLFSLVGAIDDGADIHLFQNKEILHVQSGKSRYKLNTLPAETYPVMTMKEETQRGFVIEASEMIRMLRSCKASMAQQDVRYYLNGILIELDKGKLSTTSSDGHRMTVCRYRGEMSFQDTNFSAILPRKTVDAVLKVIEASDEDVTVKLYKNFISFESRNVTINAKIIDGKYPGISSFTQAKDHTIVATVETDAFIQSIKRTKILFGSGDKNVGVRLSLDDNQMQLHAFNNQDETSDEVLDTVFSGDKVEIGLNTNYLNDALDTINAESAMIRMRDPNQFVLITEKDCNATSTICVVMPLRL